MEPSGHTRLRSPALLLFIFDTNIALPDGAVEYTDYISAEV